MPTTIDEIESQVRHKLEELEPRHWTSEEIQLDIVRGIKDLWRSIVDLKGEHYLVVNTTDVTMQSGSDTLSNVPRNVHKIYQIEPAITNWDSNANGRRLIFRPIDYNHDYFTNSRAHDPIDASFGDTVFYAITRLGGPTQAPTIYVAPRLNAAVTLRFSYVPTLSDLTGSSIVPVPGEADMALVAWTMAYCRAKEREDRAPDPQWLNIYREEKEKLLESLGLRQYQEIQVADAIFEYYW